MESSGNGVDWEEGYLQVVDCKTWGKTGETVIEDRKENENPV